MTAGKATISDLRKVFAVRDLPDHNLQWILDHAEYREYEDGDTIMKTGQPTELMFFLL